MKNQLLHLENQLETWVERLFGARLDRLVVFRAVARAFENHMAQAAPRQNAPAHLHLSLHPQDYTTLLAQNPQLEMHLAYYLVELARQRGAVLSADPSVVISPDPRQERLRVTARLGTADQPPAGTAQMPPVISAAPPEMPPLHAELIQHGRTLYPLDRLVVNIGRHMENHLMIADPRVSRWHCQLRVRHGHYVIYDLNSTHGTFVNSARIVEYILRSGDVISLGGVPLLYWEEEPSQAFPSDTQDWDQRG